MTEARATAAPPGRRVAAAGAASRAGCPSIAVTRASRPTPAAGAPGSTTRPYRRGRASRRISRALTRPPRRGAP
ncbi:hypothetical protein [Actinomadura sp. GTD37]|uniref:hypothetical protein n=1 Tax=Actinomadura sp. GTD37 TaxID=1778030 RepID=UPI0035C0BCCE